MAKAKKGKCKKWSKTNRRTGKRRCLKRVGGSKRKTKCLKWAKGRSRCMKRAKR